MSKKGARLRTGSQARADDSTIMVHRVARRAVVALWWARRQFRTSRQAPNCLQRAGPHRHAWPRHFPGLGPVAWPLNERRQKRRRGLASRFASLPSPTQPLTCKFCMTQILRKFNILQIFVNLIVCLRGRRAPTPVYAATVRQLLMMGSGSRPANGSSTFDQGNDGAASAMAFARLDTR